MYSKYIYIIEYQIFIHFCEFLLSGTRSLSNFCITCFTRQQLSPVTNDKLHYELRCWMQSFSPLLLVQQREKRASRHVLGHNGKLAGVVQTSPHKLDNAGVIEATQDGDLPAEHVHVWLWAVGVGSIATRKESSPLNSVNAKFALFRRYVTLTISLPFDGNNFVPAFAPVDSPKGAWEWNRISAQWDNQITWVLIEQKPERHYLIR